MSPSRHITRAIARHLHLRVRHALPIARNSSTRKSNRSRMTEHVNQKAQLIVRDTALALRTTWGSGRLGRLGYRNGQRKHARTGRASHYCRSPVRAGVLGGTSGDARWTRCGRRAYRRRWRAGRGTAGWSGGSWAARRRSMQCSPARRRQGELLASAIVGHRTTLDQAGRGERGEELGGGGPRDAGAARKVGAHVRVEATFTLVTPARCQLDRDRRRDPALAICRSRPSNHAGNPALRGAVRG
jgi:hypothetical protein